MAVAAMSGTIAGVIWNSFSGVLLRLARDNAFTSGIVIGGVAGFLCGTLAGSFVLDYYDTKQYKQRERRLERDLSEDEVKRRRRERRMRKLVGGLKIGGAAVFIFVSFLGIVVLIGRVLSPIISADTAKILYASILILMMLYYAVSSWILKYTDR